jgi:hypothetical protein
VLERLLELAVLTALGDDLRLADGELEALAAHVLDEDREGELTATLHLPASGRPMSTTLSETLPMSSRSRRSLTMRAVSL